MLARKYNNKIKMPSDPDHIIRAGYLYKHTYHTLHILLIFIWPSDILFWSEITPSFKQLFPIKSTHTHTLCFWYILFALFEARHFACHFLFKQWNGNIRHFWFICRRGCVASSPKVWLFVFICVRACVLCALKSPFLKLMFKCQKFQST